jgi:hypothetical protein
VENLGDVGEREVCKMELKEAGRSNWPALKRTLLSLGRSEKGAGRLILMQVIVVEAF